MRLPSPAAPGSRPELSGIYSACGAADLLLALREAGLGGALRALRALLDRGALAWGATRRLLPLHSGSELGGISLMALAARPAGPASGERGRAGAGGWGWGPPRVEPGERSAMRP